MCLGLRWLVALCSFLVCAQLGRAYGSAQEANSNKHRANLRQREKKWIPFLQYYDGVITSPACSCACCVVEARRPGEIDGPIMSKCAVPPLGSSKKCPNDRCSRINDGVLGSANTVAVERFCFYHCQPQGALVPQQKIQLSNQVPPSADGGWLYDSGCGPLPASIEAHATGSDGNGIDPEAAPAVT
eukprot:gnl/TRDRNA2_/TRDRNA2_183149_c0_seq1.p1 gnl/TRDRNA2_/TRDRNA2_183149_c0~~gnl/TRDRNA2_/TRDRNA2_183149_c0_seq1.p1  ORF type:complete len:186 (-),score=21.98 gnl/TRDRNA2_/TRDRNA2_183149_c0_seq1:248-805(-)